MLHDDLILTISICYLVIFPYDSKYQHGEQMEACCQDGPKPSNCSEYLGEEEEPDWNSIARHEPTRSDVPMLLNARKRRVFINIVRHFESLIKLNLSATNYSQ